jgi:hypothetical protein
MNCFMDVMVHIQNVKWKNIRYAVYTMRRWKQIIDFHKTDPFLQNLTAKKRVGGSDWPQVYLYVDIMS